ncbi:hypothetical protein J3458_001573 [Metarhizium acridum]|uniref:uncharacterized protein n=1 Tax=Metarhizium acridum TaxID=92637 RepID=UPI001C6B240B|nr:hypothetical protein J3458_001573 [Metarhizium acridum]
MDLENLNLRWEVKSASRSLGYGPSCKVGVRFKSLWWKKPPCNITTGSAGRPTSPSDVLPGLYCWGQEANRIGDLINRKSPEGEGELKKVLIRDRRQV